MSAPFPSLEALITDLSRPVALLQFEVLLLAVLLWLGFSRWLKPSQRHWPWLGRWPWLRAVQPLSDALLLFVLLSAAAQLLDALTGVAGLALVVSRFYGLCLLSRLAVVGLRQLLPLDVVNRFDVRVLRPGLALAAVVVVLAQVGDVQLLWRWQLLQFGEDAFTLGDLLLLLLGSYGLVAGTALPAWGLAWLCRRLFSLAEPSYRATALVLRYLMLGFGSVLILATVGVNTTILAVVGGGLSVGLGFGLKEAFSNFLSGVWLLLEGAVRPGDVLLLESPHGEEDPCEVLELGLRATTLWRARDNVELLVPNQTFFTQPTVTYNGSRDSCRRGQVLICVDHHHSPDVVMALLEGTARSMADVMVQPPPQALLLHYDPSGITYAVRYWIRDPMKGITIASDLSTALWHATTKAGIAIALPKLSIQSNARTQI